MYISLGYHILTIQSFRFPWTSSCYIQISGIQHSPLSPGLSLFQEMACRVVGTKPLRDPMHIFFIKMITVNKFEWGLTQNAHIPCEVYTSKEGIIVLTLWWRLLDGWIWKVPRDMIQFHDFLCLVKVSVSASFSRTIRDTPLTLKRLPSKASNYRYIHHKKGANLTTRQQSKPKSGSYFLRFNW